WMKNQVELTQELNETLYEQSQGIVDIAVKLYALSQGRAIETEKETITPAMIRKVANDDLKLVQPMLKALKSGLPSEIEKYEDIMPMDIEEYLQYRSHNIDLKATIQKKKEKQSEERQKQQSSVLEKVILALIGLEIDPKLAEKAATSVLKRYPNSSQAELM